MLMGARFGQFAQNAAKGAMHVVSRGMVPWFENAVMPVFDMFWFIPSMEDAGLQGYGTPAGPFAFLMTALRTHSRLP